MMRHSKLLASVLLLSLLSCGKETVAVQYADNESAEEQKFGSEMVLGEKLNNPYSLANMQAAYESLVRTKSGCDAEVEQLEANWLYVRFLPTDSTDVAVLESLDLELFDYPLDYDIEVEGNSYHDPSIPEDEITWQYTTVKPDFQFPDMEYQILEECYIPEESDDTKSGGNTGFATELELIAIQNAGLPERYLSSAGTKALGLGEKPEGTLKVKNDISGLEEGIRGAKVRCHWLVNISSGYTDANGNYKIKNRYVFNPHYAIVYDNTKDFVIWGNWAFVAAANHNLGRHSNEGYSTTVQTSEEGWRWAVINNAAYDFYDMCTSEGIKTPPSKLKIWCWPDVGYSSAPMLHHIFGFTSSRDFATDFASAQGIVEKLSTTMIYAAESFIRKAMPDLTLGMNKSDYGASPNNNYSEHYFTVWHELFHASHFSQVGEGFWGPYVDYIVTSGFGYGDGTSTNTRGKNICELGESWAYANQYYASGAIDKGYWFFPAITSIYNVIEKEYVSTAKAYSCLTTDVNSIDALFERLIAKAPLNANYIEDEFARNKSLTDQSLFVVRNCTGTRLSVNYVQQGDTTSVSLAAGKELILRGFSGNADCMTEKIESILDLYEDLTISYYNKGRSIECFQMKNGIVNKNFKRSLFEDSCWISSSTHETVGNKNTTIYTYEIKTSYL